MKTAADVAIMLSDIYETAFGGKERGRFRISRNNLKILADRKVIKQSFVDELKEEAWEYELVVVDLEDGFVVIDVNLLDSYRFAPKNVVKEIVEEFDEEYGDEEEYEEDEEDDDYDDDDDEEDDDEEGDDEEDEDEDEGDDDEPAKQ